MELDVDETAARVTRLRAGYRSGLSIPEVIRGEATFSTVPSHEIMDALMSTFNLSLSDVTCIDGWWPPASEVSDDNLDRWIRDAIERHRSEWDG